jgi:hypothetical protein
MTLSKIRRTLYKTARFMGDVSAVKRGRVIKRVENRMIGRIVGKALRKIFR